MGKKDQLSELETKAAEIEKKLTELKKFVGSFGKWFNDQNGIIQAISDRQAKFQETAVATIKSIDERLERLEKRARGEHPDPMLS